MEDKLGKFATQIPSHQVNSMNCNTEKYVRDKHGILSYSAVI
jgi:hypothetical protein